MRQFLRPFPRIAALTGAVFLGNGCHRDPDPAGTEPQPKEELSAPHDEQPKEEVLHIPIGEFTIGSDPGEPGRDPALEPLATKLRLGPFRIDGHLAQNDDGSVKLGLSRDEAETVCAAKQGRLCSEAEWERACRGPSSAIYPGGNEPCGTNDTCRSGFDTWQMTQWPEWTASRFGRDSEKKESLVVRGARRELAPELRRCATRRFPSEGDSGGPGVPRSEIAFRCCYGAPNAAVIKEPSFGPAYRETTLSTEDLRKLLSEDSRTAAFAKDASFFKTDAAATVLARGPGETKGFQLTTAPVLWQPSPGTLYLVLAAHQASSRTSFVLAYYENGERRKLAGSFIMKNEPGPIARA